MIAAMNQSRSIFKICVKRVSCSAGEVRKYTSVKPRPIHPDSIHHIAPGWIGLGFTLVYFLTSPAEQLTRFTHILKMDLLWFIAAIIGLTALVQHLDMQ